LSGIHRALGSIPVLKKASKKEGWKEGRKTKKRNHKKI
jgi:hypothetical protein